MFAGIVSATLSLILHFPHTHQTKPSLHSPIPIKTQYAMLHGISPTPTSTPSPTPTNTPTPTPTPTDTPTPTPTPQPIVTSQDLESLFSRFSDEYHVDKDHLKRIALCESGMNTNASANSYAGLFQFGELSWVTTRTAMGLSPDENLRSNAEEAIKTAAYTLSHNGDAAWPHCR